MKKLECLGSGTYGTVYKCIYNLNLEEPHEEENEFSENKNVYSIKIFKDIECEGYYKEILFFKSFVSNNIIKYYKTIYDDNNPAVLMEYKENDLHSYIRENNLEKDQIKKIMYGICKCLYDMHTNRFIHGDLKTRNIVLNNSDDVKVIDFSLVQFVLNRKTNVFPNTTINIMPPEVLYNLQSKTRNKSVNSGTSESSSSNDSYDSDTVKNIMHSDFKVDIWALGCIFLELFRKEKYFICQTNKKLEELHKKFFEKCKNSEDEKLFGNYDNVELETDLLFKMLCDKNDRYDITQILKHEYFKDLLDFEISDLDKIIEERTIKNSKSEFDEYKNFNDIKINKLNILFEWLIITAKSLKYESQETQLLLHVIVIYFNNLTNNNEKIKVEDFQLIGISFLYIVMFVSPTLYIPIEKYISLTHNKKNSEKKSKREIFGFTEKILMMIDKFYYITPIYFMNDLTNNDKEKKYLLAIDISNTTYFNMFMLKYSSYDIAIASINIMNHIFNKKNVIFGENTIENKIIKNIKSLDIECINSIFGNSNFAIDFFI